MRLRDLSFFLSFFFALFFLPNPPSPLPGKKKEVLAAPLPTPAENEQKSIDDTTPIGREIRCLPYAGFFLLRMHIFRKTGEDLKKVQVIAWMRIWIQPINEITKGYQEFPFSSVKSYKTQ